MIELEAQLGDVVLHNSKLAAQRAPPVKKGLKKTAADQHSLDEEIHTPQPW